MLNTPAADWLIRLAIVLAMYAGAYAAQAGEWFRGVCCAA